MEIEKQSGWDMLQSAICSHIEGQDRLRGRVSEWERRMAFWSGWIIWARRCPVEVLKLDTGIPPDVRELELAESAESYSITLLCDSTQRQRPMTSKS